MKQDHSDISIYITRIQTKLRSTLTISIPLLSTKHCSDELMGSAQQDRSPLCSASSMIGRGTQYPLCSFNTTKMRSNKYNAFNRRNLETQTRQTSVILSVFCRHRCHPAMPPVTSHDPTRVMVSPTLAAGSGPSGLILEIVTPNSFYTKSNN